MVQKLNLKIILCLLLCALFGTSVLYDLALKPKVYKDNEQGSISLENLPEVRFNTLDNVSYSIASLKEPVIFLHFWASWCATCKVEFPDLLRLVNDSEGKVALVSLSIDKDLNKMKQALSAFEDQMPDQVKNKHVYWVWDEQEKSVARQFGIKKVPETIVINQDRMMVDKFVGKTDWLSDELLKTIQMSLEQNNRS